MSEQTFSRLARDADDADWYGVDREWDGDDAEWHSVRAEPDEMAESDVWQDDYPDSESPGPAARSAGNPEAGGIPKARAVVDPPPMANVDQPSAEIRAIC